MSENEHFGLVIAETGSINLGLLCAEAEATSHCERNKIQTVTVNLTQCDCLFPCLISSFLLPCGFSNLS
jgi:hypothetical protein